MEQIPLDVFELGSAISNLSGDFFMGLSNDVDPTKDLPPVTEADVDVIEIGDDVGGVNRPEGMRKDFCIDGGDDVRGSESAALGVGGNSVDIVSPLDVVDESISAPGVMGSNPFVLKSVGIGGSDLRSRPKKLVSSRHLGLMNREQFRKSRQVVYSSSSDDEVEEHPETGEKRTRVGFLFKTVPRPILSDFLTDDDKWKLEGCSPRRRTKRAERVAGLVCKISVCCCFCSCDGFLCPS